MGKRSRPIGLVVSLALVVFMTLGTMPAQGAVYKAGYYNIYYNNSTELSWARSLAAYLNEAWRSAYTVIGKNSLKGQINLYFYNKKDGRTGYTTSGQNGYLNRYYFSSYNLWGAGVAYNTTKLLFYNYTGAASWNSGLNGYALFISSALSEYASGVVYAYGPKYSKATISANLKNYYSKTGYYGSWGASAYYYSTYINANLRQQSIWSMRAIGQYLAGGLTRSTSKQVANLVTYMRNNVSSLSSFDYFRALLYSENVFKLAYGYYANYGFFFTGVDNYKSTNYLYGKYWAAYYK